MPAFDPIDSWFEKGFRVRKQAGARTARRDAVRSKSGGGGSRAGVKMSSAAKANTVKSVIKKAPEVMVKITGSSSGLATLKHHLEYISRNGQIEMENECGESIRGLADIKALREQLKASQIPNESSKREFLHVIFSMPKGTPEKAMRESVAEFCREEFASRRYVMACHDDTDHVHLHVCVGTRDIDRADEPRLSPRKADLARWRQGFADKLRENGVDAAASDRRHRFNHRKPEHPVVRQIRADNPQSSVYNAERDKERSLTRAMKAAMRPDTAFVGPIRPPRTPKVLEQREIAHRAAVATGTRPENPAHARVERNRQAALQGWQRVADNLARDGDVELAAQVRELMKAGSKPARSEAQERFDTAMAARAVAKDRDGLDR